MRVMVEDQKAQEWTDVERKYEKKAECGEMEKGKGSAREGKGRRQV